MAGANVPDWREYATSIGARSRLSCSVCDLPADVIANIHDAWGAGMRSTFVARYLAACGHDSVTQSMVDNHFKRRHAV